MNRRKLWAAAACCLAFTAHARSQSIPAPSATLGKPQAASLGAPVASGTPAPAPSTANPQTVPYVARGTAPGYPNYVPPYVGGPQFASIRPASATVPIGAVRQTQFATGGTGPVAMPPVGTPGVPMPAVPAPPAGFGPAPVPMPMPMGTAPMPMGTVPMPMGTVPAPRPMVATPMPGGTFAVPPTPVYSAMPGGHPAPMVSGSNFGTPTPFLDGFPNASCASPVPGCVTDCCPCGPMPHVWIAPEFISWRGSGMRVPPLVSAAPPGSPGTLDDANTTVLFGGNRILTDWRAGFRIRGGVWFDKCGNAGLDLGYFALHTLRDQFVAQSSGDPGLFRPFFNTTPLDENGNVLPAAEDAQLVAFIDANGNPILAGRVTVNNLSDVLGAEANFRQVLCCLPQGGGDACGPMLRVDLLAGYRYLRLRDVVSIREDLIATDPDEVGAPLGTRITVFDRFETINEFHGAQVGLASEWKSGRYFMNVRSTVALGVTRQRTRIDGSTRVETPDGGVSTATGGLLAQVTNIGSYEENRFTVIPEVGVNLGMELSKNFRIFGGYNFLYWSSVTRAGEAIDRNVNGTFIPNLTPDIAPTGPTRPQYDRSTTSYLLHGWNVGLEFRW